MKTGRKQKPLSEKKIQVTVNRCFTPQEISSLGGLESLKVKMKEKVLEI